MDRLTWSASDGADWEGFRRRPGRAVVASCHALLDDLNLALESCCPGIDQGNVSGQAHSIDVTSRINVVQGVERQFETSKPLDVELWILDICVVRNDLDVRIELLRRILGHLYIRQHSFVRLGSRVSGVSPYQCFGPSDMLVSEEELAVEVTEVDCIKVDNVNLRETGQGEVLQQFAADATCTDHQHTSLSSRSQQCFKTVYLRQRHVPRLGN